MIHTLGFSQYKTIFSLEIYIQQRSYFEPRRVYSFAISDEIVIEAWHSPALVYGTKF